MCLLFWIIYFFINYINLTFIILKITSSATNLIQDENGASSGTEILIYYKYYYVLKGNFGSDDKIILKVTFY
jgi:hypothetical protein